MTDVWTATPTISHSGNSVNNYIAYGDSWYAGSVSEAASQIKCRAAGVSSNAGCYVRTNARSTNTIATLKVNGSNGNQSYTVGGGVTGKVQDTSNTDTISDGNTYSVDFATSTGGGSINAMHFLKITPTSGHDKQFCAADAVNNISNATYQRYLPICGDLDYRTPETLSQTAVPATGDATNLQLYIVDTSDADMTLDFRIGGVAGNMTLTPTTTGFYEDTSNTDALTAGNLINTDFFADNRTSGSYSPVMVGINYQTDTEGFPMMRWSNSFVASGQVHYIPIMGGSDESTTEADVDFDSPENFTLNSLYSYKQFDDGAVNPTLNMRINGSNGNLTITSTAGVTGVISDTSNSDSISTGDKINYQGTGHDVGVRYYSCGVFAIVSEGGGGGGDASIRYKGGFNFNRGMIGFG